MCGGGKGWCYKFGDEETEYRALIMIEGLARS